jgi:Tol biopolymer transport system component
MLRSEMTATGDAITVNAPDALEGRQRAPVAFAWLTLLLGTWLTLGLLLIATVYGNRTIDDTVVSIYHLPYYLGVIALAGLCLLRIARARRAGRDWRTAFPSGYLGLPLAAVLLAIWPIVEVGWREGIGVRPDSIEQVFAPSRLLVFAGILLVDSAPLYAALRSSSATGGGWPPVLSAALILSVLGVVGFQPAQNPWLEAPLNDASSRSEIWVMDGDGSHQTRLISLKGFDLGNAVWSADGTRIAYTMSATPRRQGTPAENTSIWTADADGSHQQQVIAGVGWYWLPHWSPDGAWILFTLDGQRGPGSGSGILPPDVGFGQPPAAGQPPTVTPNVDVWRIRSDGSGGVERLTTDPAEDRAGVYGPDGSQLLFDSTRGGGHTALYVATDPASAAVQMTSFDDAWGGSWSPDGSRIAFNGGPFGVAYDIYVVSVPAGGSPQQLTFDLGNDRVPSWSPDGSRIAFESDRDSVNDIWSMDASGADQVNLTATTAAAEGLTSGGQAWGPDGRILYARSQDGPANTSSLVRENLGVIGTLLGALLLAFLVMLVISVSAPFGAVTVILTLSTAAAAVGSADWRFVLAALVAGLIVDVLIRLAPPPRRLLVGTAAAAGAFVLAGGATVLATSVIGWSVTLLLGVAIAAAALGWAMAALYQHARRGKAGAAAIE